MSKDILNRDIIRLIMRVKTKLFLGVVVFVLVLIASFPLSYNRVHAATLKSEAQIADFIKTLAYKDASTIVGEFNGEKINFFLGQCPNASLATTGNKCWITTQLNCDNTRAYISQARGNTTTNTDPDPVLRVSIEDGTCQPKSETLAFINNANNAETLFARLDQKTIVTRFKISSDDNAELGEKFILNSQGRYLRENETGERCQDYITVSGNNATLLRQGTSGIDQCKEVEKITSRLGTITQAELNASQDIDGESVADEVECDANLRSPLSWILCPIIDMLAGFTEFVFDKFIKPFLEDVPISTEEGDGTYEAWKQFRLIGNIVLVGTMMAVVYSQIKGDR